MMKPAVATPEDEVRSTFDRFVAAQNAHDIKAMESLLLGSPDFLWVTRGAPVWGQDAALKRFAALYEGTWRLDPEPTSLKVIMIGGDVAGLRADNVYHRSGRPTVTAGQVLDEPSAGKNTIRMESVKYPADPCARANQVSDDAAA